MIGMKVNNINEPKENQSIIPFGNSNKDLLKLFIHSFCSSFFLLKTLIIILFRGRKITFEIILFIDAIITHK